MDEKDKVARKIRNMKKYVDFLRIWWIAFIKLSYIQNNRVGGERENLPWGHGDTMWIAWNL